MIQMAIFILGAASIWCIAQKRSWSWVGFLIGLISEPFWFYTTISHKQWGMFCLCIWFTVSYIQGLWNYKLRKSK